MLEGASDSRMTSTSPVHTPSDSAATPSINTLPEHRFRYRSEFSRVRDVDRQLDAWENIYLPSGLPEISLKNGVGSLPCPDAALAAFVQLAALRMNTRRAIVSLICEDHEHVLAEVSRTTPLQRALGEQMAEPLCIGTGKFPLSQGLTRTAVNEWRKARRPRDTPSDSDHYYLRGLTQHSFIINDMRTDVDHKDSKFAKHIPWTRFYCSVPLRGVRGSIIGQLAVFDDVPRYGVSSEQVTLLEDIADTIVEHLDALIVRVQRQVSDRHLQSLSVFTAGGSSLRDWWTLQDDARVLRAGRTVTKGTALERQNRIDAEFGAATNTSLDSVSHVGKSYLDHKSTAPAVTDSPSETDIPRMPFSNARTRVDSAADVEVMFTTLYTRASNLIREALGTTGSVFVDFKQTTTSDGQERPDADADTLSSSSSGSQAESECNCETLGYSVHTVSSAAVEKIDSPFTLQRSALRRLVKRYPKGAVIHFDNNSVPHVSSDEESNESQSQVSQDQDNKAERKKDSAQALATAVKDCKSIAFLPLWDNGNQRWSSCVFVWSDSAARLLDTSHDLLFLSTFGQSVSTGVSHIQNVATNVIKDTFISSISHELRSPLHGILAGTEFLQETELTAFQSEMVQATQTAGRVLLDTIDHVLDYSKISRRLRTNKYDKSSALSRSSRSRQRDVPQLGVNLATLTEDVIETCLAANRSQEISANLPDSRSGKHDHIAALKKANTDVAVTLNIDRQPNWQVKIQPGAWIRILTNIVGNALKYTQHGHISIHLHANSVDDGEMTIQLVVEDTGCGMSKNFLSHNLFVPFKQQNSFAPGTGLGLSITKALVDGLRGKLSVRSKEHVGTKVTLSFNAQLDTTTAHPVDAEVAVDHFEMITLPSDRQLSVNESSTRSSKIESSVLQTAEKWLGCEAVATSKPQHKNTSGQSVCAMTDDVLERLCLSSGEAGRRLLEQVSEHYSHVIVLATSKSSVQLNPAITDLPLTHVFVHQPIGPHRLLSVITSDKHSTLVPKDVLSPGPMGEHSWQHTKSLDADVDGQRSRQSEGSSQSASEDDTVRSRRAKAASAKHEHVKQSPESSWSNDDSWTDNEGPSVLLVDDNEINMKFLTTLMRKLKVSYRCAKNGQEAIEMYRQHGNLFILVLMDISMPIMDGFTATAEIRKHESKASLTRTCVAALTGVTSQESKDRAFTCGADYFYSKPVKMKELQLLLERVRGGHDS